MDQAARVAFVHAQVVCAQAKIEGMRAANAAAMWALQAPPYSQEDFEKVPDEFLLGHNTVIEYLREG